ncbi:MFS transporter [Pseudalkalibacillus salsuginis]|uniref:MFS transporter n=1 Tax=Pseudalkalibacillus salsuginis TaxID=2910972 RepID=UPI001F444BE4|nr:MFS transporter [Pseudalkalibacillus salsuginis]MCF6411402.1 MFS transporter [Pseudalkalibacillus salsuginis]
MDERRKGMAAIFTVLFLVSLSLHIQYPIFTPYAVALGATSFFVSIMMSVSSFANMCGNLIAGPLIDAFGKKKFIVVPLFLSGLLMMGHGIASNPDGLLVLRLFNGLVLAFMTPACFALLSGYAKNSHQQGKNMAFNGLLMTIAHIVSPTIGGYLVELVDYQGTYFIIGGCILITAVIGVMSIREFEPITVYKKEQADSGGLRLDKHLLMIYFVAFALMYAQGTIGYELPFLVVEKGMSTSDAGKLFSYIGVGTLVIVCMTWINRISALIRTMFGMLVLAACFYQMVVPFAPLSLSQLLFVVGIGLGILFPAITTLITEKIDKSKHGTAFGILSAVFSLGIIASSLTAGAIRAFISPYFIAFIVVALAITIIGWQGIGQKEKSIVSS